VLSVLIVNWNTREKLRACLASLEGTDAEVIVVDNASADNSAEMVRADFPWVRLIEAGYNSGYARGNNIAFEHATGDYLLTLNPDTEVPKGALEKSIWILEEHPECGCIAPRLQGPDGEIQASVRGWPTMLGVLGAFTKLDKLFPASALGSYRLPAFDYSVEQFAPQPMGTFLLFKRSALEAIQPPSRATSPIGRGRSHESKSTTDLRVRPGEGIGNSGHPLPNPLPEGEGAISGGHNSSPREGEVATRPAATEGVSPYDETNPHPSRHVGTTSPCKQGEVGKDLPSPQSGGAKLSPFDEDFPIFFNEVDLLKRLDEAGYKTLFTPAITILHHHGASTGQVKKPMIWESHRSLIRYLRKHTRGAARFVLPLFALVVWVGALIRARGIYAGFRVEHHNL